MQVWKFRLAPPGMTQRIEMPAGAEILHCAIQHHAPQLWALVDQAREKEERLFITLGTGHEFEPPPNTNALHRGTYFQDDGHFVWHVFELAPRVKVTPLINTSMPNRF